MELRGQCPDFPRRGPGETKGSETEGSGVFSSGCWSNFDFETDFRSQAREEIDQCRGRKQGHSTFLASLTMSWTVFLTPNQSSASESHHGLWLVPQARRNSRIRSSPAGIERMAGAVDIDDQRCVIRGYRFSLPRLAIDFGPYNAVFQRRRHE